jgi:glycerate kinase
MYSAQKGATLDQLDFLESAMGHFFGVVEAATGKAVRNLPGAGSAGGCGAGFAAFLNARIESGVGLLLDAVRFTERITGADLILTGEGKVEGQTLHGKAVRGVAEAAKPLGVPVIVIAGEVAPEAEALFDLGVVSLFSICPGPVSIADAVGRVEPLIAQTVERILRVWKAVRE